MTVQRAQSDMSSTDFVDWVAYLNEDVNAFHREDYFLASIAAEVRCTYVKEPMKVKLSDFLIKFKEKVKQKKVNIEEKTKRSKAFWGTVTGFTKRKKKQNG